MCIPGHPGQFVRCPLVQIYAHSSSMCFSVQHSLTRLARREDAGFRQSTWVYTLLSQTMARCACPLQCHAAESKYILHPRTLETTPSDALAIPFQHFRKILVPVSTLFRPQEHLYLSQQVVQFEGKVIQ